MDPVFQTLDHLKGSLRLTGICEGGSAVPILLDAIESARLEMVTAFGLAGFTAHTLLDDPAGSTTTEAHYTYLTLRKLETRLVEHFLCYRLKQMYDSSSADRHEEFEHVAAFRSLDPELQERYCKKIWEEVQRLFHSIGVQESYRPAGTLQILEIGADCTPPLVIGMGANVSPATCGGDRRTNYPGGRYGLGCS